MGHFLTYLRIKAERLNAPIRSRSGGVASAKELETMDCHIKKGPGVSPRPLRVC